jgi:hypothetical protein
MRLALLAAAIFTLSILVLVGIVHLVRELLVKDFFQPPSMPGEPADRNCEMRSEASSRPASGLHS